MLVLVCLLGGCRRDPLAAPPATRDLAAPVPSLACAGMEGCVSACSAGPDACARSCAARLSPTARPYYDALQACVAPTCGARDGGSAACLQPSSLACKLCVMSHCGALATACVAH